MALFIGSACFSPRVPSAVRREWVENGGELASMQRDNVQATHVFCDGSDDPWFRNLYKRSMAIFHWSWVSEVVRAQFRLPISSYLIEEDPSDADMSAYIHDVEEPGFHLLEDDSGTRLGSPDGAVGWSRIEPDSKPGLDFLKTAYTLGDVSMEGETLVLDGAFAPGATSAISVSDALSALGSVSVDGVVQFIPGTMHLGKEFRCSYAQ